MVLVFGLLISAVLAFICWVAFECNARLSFIEKESQLSVATIKGLSDALNEAQSAITKLQSDMASCKVSRKSPPKKIKKLEK